MKINAKPLPKTHINKLPVKKTGYCFGLVNQVISFDTPIDDRFDTPASYGAFAQQAY